MIKGIKNINSEMLTALERLESGEILAICFCGNYRLCIVGCWNAGRYKSCKSCAKYKMSKNAYERFSKGRVGLENKLIKSYQYAARRRGFDFLLTKDEFFKIIIQKCHYCHLPPSQYAKSRARKTRMGNDKDDFLYTGVDRVDSLKGYTIQNCVPCCEQCNRAKFTMSYDEYLLFINRFRNGGIGWKKKC